MAEILILPETVQTGKINLGNKQDKLISGKNIKTINGESILGEGDIEVKGGSSGVTILLPNDSTFVEDVNTAEFIAHNQETYIKLFNQTDKELSVSMQYFGHNILCNPTMRVRFVDDGVNPYYDYAIIELRGVLIETNRVYRLYSDGKVALVNFNGDIFIDTNGVFTDIYNSYSISGEYSQSRESSNCALGVDYFPQIISDGENKFTIIDLFGRNKVIDVFTGEDTSEPNITNATFDSSTNILQVHGGWFHQLFGPIDNDIQFNFDPITNILTTVEETITLSGWATITGYKLTRAKLIIHREDNLTEYLANKVDKVSGKGLSSNDFTDAHKGALDGLDDALASKQDLLVSGENVKTINGESILGNGDIITDPTILDFALLGVPVLGNTYNEYYTKNQVLAATGLDDYDLLYSSLTERPLVIKKGGKLVYPCSVSVSGSETRVYYKLLNYNSVKILDLLLCFSEFEQSVGHTSYRLTVNDTELNLATQGELDDKQDTLKSGINIKTVGGQSILGTGDIPFNFSNYYTKKEIDDKGYSITISTAGTEQGGYKLTREIVSRAYDSGCSLYYKVSNNDGSIKIVQLNVERTLDSVEGAYIYYVWGWWDKETIIEWTFGNTIEDAGVYGTYVEGFDDSSYYGYPSKGNLIIEETDNVSYNAKVTLFGGTKNAVTTYANIASDNKSISLIGGKAGNMGTLSATTLTISDGVVSGKIPMSFPTINDYIATSAGGGSITIIPIEETSGTHRSIGSGIDLSAYATKDELTTSIAEAITNTLNKEI